MNEKIEVAVETTELLRELHDEIRSDVWDITETFYDEKHDTTPRELVLHAIRNEISAALWECLVHIPTNALKSLIAGIEENEPKHSRPKKKRGRPKKK
jgi:hypothetical protein